jgi:hypothetical protein
MAQHSKLPRTAARDTAAGGNGKAFHNASLLAARHSTVARRRGPAACSVSSATAALQVQQRTLFETVHL